MSDTHDFSSLFKVRLEMGALIMTPIEYMGKNSFSWESISDPLELNKPAQ